MVNSHMTNERFPKNVEGDFYTTGTIALDGEWMGDCLWCGLPEMEASDLLAPLDNDNLDTYFVRQPISPEEIERALSALEVCCVNALRYGGKDKNILKRLDSSLCDYKINKLGKVVSNK